MNPISPILPIPGVPDDLLRALNDRFRLLASPDSAAVDTIAVGFAMTHRARAAANLAMVGSYGTEIDRGVVYQVQNIGSGKTWVYVAGTMAETAANRPGDLGSNDAGFLFLATDTLKTSRWDGAAWVDFGSAPISTQAVVTGSRAIGTVYRNTGTTAMYVLVTLACTAAGGATFGQADVKTDAANPPTTVVTSTLNGSATATVYAHLAFWVLPGNYYKVQLVTNTVTLARWVEWQ